MYVCIYIYIVYHCIIIYKIAVTHQKMETCSFQHGIDDVLSIISTCPNLFFLATQDATLGAYFAEGMACNKATASIHLSRKSLWKI